MKNCIQCSTKLVGRRDKKFCSDYCRSEYHNEINRTQSHLIRQVNTKLKRNYSILRKFAEKQEYDIQKSQLIENGYRFDYFTQVIWQEQAPIYCLYDLQFIPLDTNQIRINPNKQTEPS